MNNKTEGEMIMSQRRALDKMRYQGIFPKHQVLNNEILAAYRKEIRENHMTFQLLLPYDNRSNLSEKAIQTWKDHFIGVMSETAANLPVHL